MSEKGGKSNPTHRVHFGEDADTFGKDNEIVVQPSGENKVSLHLGFLKLHHRYEIKVDVPRVAWGVKEEAGIREHEPRKVLNVNCKIIGIAVDKNVINLTLELFAHKEKLLKEEVCLETVGDGVVLHACFIARVLGKGKGTPLLRNGIHCIGVEEADDESEASDWQGFE